LLLQSSPYGLRVNTLPTASKSRFSWFRQVLKIEQILIFIGLVVYALLASLNQKPSLVIIMVAMLTVGNLLIPFAFLCRRVYADRPFPWNWMLFFPVQIMFGFFCACGSILSCN
jgi:hypothetical protein